MSLISWNVVRRRILHIKSNTGSRMCFWFRKVIPEISGLLNSLSSSLFCTLGSDMPIHTSQEEMSNPNLCTQSVEPIFVNLWWFEAGITPLARTPEVGSSPTHLCLVGCGRLIDHASIPCCTIHLNIPQLARLIYKCTRTCAFPQSIQLHILSITTMLLNLESFTNLQSQSPLFSILPGEIRNEIFSLALMQFEDDTASYNEDSYWYRPGFTAPHKSNSALLRTCKAAYLEGQKVFLRELEWSFWFGMWYPAEICHTYAPQSPRNMSNVLQIVAHPDAVEFTTA